MTHFQALVVKYWRVREEYSWRMVHALWQKRYVPKEQWWFNDGLLKIDNDKTFPHGNQIYGMDLCEEAMGLLNERVEDGWN